MSSKPKYGMNGYKKVRRSCSAAGNEDEFELDTESMDMLVGSGPSLEQKKISIILDEKHTDLLLQNKIKIEFDVETGRGIIAKRETEEFNEFGDDCYEQMEGDQTTNETGGG